MILSINETRIIKTYDLKLIAYNLKLHIYEDFIIMKDLKNEIKNCFTTFDKENEYEQLSAELQMFLVKAEEEMQYGDVNDAIKIALAILEELTSRDKAKVQLNECYNKALDITSKILKTPSTRSDVKLLLEYELKQINQYI